MRILVAINSCVKDIINQANQSMRDTWLPDLKKYNIDYKFFIGNGKLIETPSPQFETSWAALAKINVWKNNLHNEELGLPEGLTLKDDEICLNVPDGYKYLPFKTKESLIYAAEKGYDYVFRVFTDTYVHVNRLVRSGFEHYDYVGSLVDNDLGKYAGGGCGYWLSEKAYKLVLTEPITCWAEDAWIGGIMVKNEIPLHNDYRYDNQNNPKITYFITKHLVFHWQNKGNIGEKMKILHQANADLPFKSSKVYNHMTSPQLQGKLSIL
jgi:hypothetical protein